MTLAVAGIRHAVEDRTGPSGESIARAVSWTAGVIQPLESEATQETQDTVFQPTDIGPAEVVAGIPGRGRKEGDTLEPLKCSAGAACPRDRATCLPMMNNPDAGFRFRLLPNPQRQRGRFTAAAHRAGRPRAGFQK